MKLVTFLIPALMIGSMAMAQDAATGDTASKPLSRKAAKKACKEEGRKDLKACIHEKIKK